MTITLPPDLADELARAERADGLSAQEIMLRAVRDYLWRRRFRKLADRLSAEAEAKGIQSDEDVFRRVS
jgi:hypothetical protein